MLSNIQHNLSSFPHEDNRDIFAVPPTSRIRSIRDPSMRAIHAHRRGLSLDGGVVGRGQYLSPLPPASSGPSTYGSTMPQRDSDSMTCRPATPSKQTSPDSRPLTPATTPFRNSTDFSHNREPSQGSPIKRQIRSKPTAGTTGSSSMQRTKSLHGVAGSTYAQTRPRMASPPTNSAFFDCFDVFSPQPHDSKDAFFFYLPGEGPEGKPSLSPTSPTHTAFTLPDFGAMGAESHANSNQVPIMPAVPLMPTSNRTANSSPCSSPVKTALSPRAMSIADLNLDANFDASIEETGITNEDIAQFIEGPDPEDKKWTCTYAGCNKKFGRKENIKSHVQTHLGDRQFKCNHCNKCFVRGHDLKRHAKIHTGLKPYPCECGNSFARQDALTRHKQRGMCSGAFEGVVRKVAKRGRPPKSRPGMEERKDKARRTRERANNTNYASSESESTCTSLASPPSEILETGSAKAPSIADDMQFLHSDDVGLPPDVFTFTPPASPGLSTGNMPSPTRSYRSNTPTMEQNFLCLSPTKRPLDDIPEEVHGLPPLAPGSPTPVKLETASDPAAQFLLPSPSEPNFGDSTNQDFALFTRQAIETHGDDNYRSSLEPPSTSDFSTPNNVSSFETDLFLDPSGCENSELEAQFLSGSYSQYSEDFFNFSAEVDNHL